MPKTPINAIDPEHTVEHLSQLSDPLRLRMLRVLAQEELSVGELVTVMQIPQSSGSRHLKILTDGGWLVRRTSGTTSYYQLLIDELSPTMRAIWIAVADSVSRIPESQGDDFRLASVIAQRVSDSSTFFGKHAGQWDALRDDMFGRRFTDHALLGLLNPSWRVADLGCGTGNCTELLAPWVDSVVAVDRSPDMIKGARERIESTSSDHMDRIRFAQADLTDLPIEDRSVDAAVCMLVLHHVPDPVGVLKEACRILTDERGGGSALIVDMINHERVDYRRSLGHEHLGFAPSSIETLCNQAGFAHCRVIPLRNVTDGDGPPLFAACASVGNPNRTIESNPTD